VEKGEKVIEVYADASFGNVEGTKTQLGFVVCLTDERGGRVPIMWKSKVARRVVGSTLAAETLSIVEGVEWAEYVKKLWEEIHGEDERLKIVVKTDCKSLQEAINSVNGVKNRMLRIELANVKEKLEEKVIDRVEWIKSDEQVADGLTKWRVSGAHLRAFLGNE